MKITSPPTESPSITFRDILAGTVFKYHNQNGAFLLKISDTAFFNLQNNLFSSGSCVSTMAPVIRFETELLIKS